MSRSDLAGRRSGPDGAPVGAGLEGAEGNGRLAGATVSSGPTGAPAGLGLEGVGCDGDLDGTAGGARPNPADVSAVDPRLIPAAVVAWAAQWGIVTSSWGLRLAVPGAVVLGLVAWRRRSAAVALVAVVLVVTALVGGLRLGLLAWGTIPEWAQERAVVRADLSIASVTSASGGDVVVVRATLTAAAARGSHQTARLPVLVFVTGDGRQAWAALAPGQSVTLSARLEPPQRADAAAAIVHPLGDPTVTAEATGWRVAVEHVRAALRQAVAGAGAERAALLPALVVGDTSTMPASLTDDFKTTGLTHLTAVSGANLTILLAFLLSLARAVGVRGRALNLVAVAGVVGFVALCHSEPSVLRAAAMGLVGLAALGHSARPGAGLRQLAVAVIGLLWIDPWLARSFGFALSALACAGILWWGRRWTDALARWLPRWLAEAVAVPLAAQLATQPLVSYLSGAVSVSGLLANALAAPCVAPATVAGIVTAVVATCYAGLGSLVGSLSCWLVEPILQIAHWAASLPGATHPWPVTLVGLGVLGLSCLGLAAVMPQALGRPGVVLALAGILTAALLRPPLQPGWPPADWTVVACDVGQGDALVVRLADHAALVVDVGPPDSGLTDCLRSLDIRRVPVLVLSHLHADHVGALGELLGGWPVGAIVVGPGWAESSILQPARQRGVAIDVVQTGQTFTLGGATVEVLSARTAVLTSATSGGESSADNDASLLARLNAGGVSVLTTGDLEQFGQQLARSRGIDLSADILKVPHHGSASQDPAFLAASHASVGLISVGRKNDYGQPAASTVGRLGQLGMTVARTDEHGSIAVSRRDGLIQVTSQR